jgi:hypothetical protein
LDPLRNADDLKALQLISGYFAAFTRSGNPNPSMKYLQVRGYTNVSFLRVHFPPSGSSY